MAMIAECDGCGEQMQANHGGMHWIKPYTWYERKPEGEDKPIMACSRECIQKVEARRKQEGKSSTTVVLPF